MPNLLLERLTLYVAVPLNPSKLSNEDAETFVKALLPLGDGIAVSTKNVDFENDGLFQYLLSIRLFNGAGTLSLKADGLNVDLENIVSKENIELVSGFFAGILPLVGDRARPWTFQWQADASFQNGENGEEVFQKLAPSGCEHGGFMGWTRVGKTLMKISVEKRMGVENTAFLTGIWSELDPTLLTNVGSLLDDIRSAFVAVGFTVEVASRP